MNSETVHLIATDPPFNKNKDFHATPDKLASDAKFKDRWRWEEDVHAEWIDQIQDDWPATWAVIESTRRAYGTDMAAFLCWLGVRLMEMRRILRNDGSIYLHIDHTAHAYVKALMDSIFGAKNFRNEIVWSYRTGGVSKKYFARKHDTLLFYTKGNEYTFNPLKEKAYTKSSTRKPGIVNYGKGSKEFFEDSFGIYNLVYMRDVWEISYIGSTDPERYGYPTQKPLELYKRIIKASSNENDIVLDPFCGCATTPVAAELLNRKWVGIDIWEKAHEAVLDRLKKNGLAVPDEELSEATDTRFLTFGNVIYKTMVLERTDGDEMAAPTLRLRSQRPKEPWQKLTNHIIKRLLAEVQKGVNSKVICAGCGRELEVEFMHLDHVQPKSESGDNWITNRVLLCGPCNRHKSDRLTIKGLHKENQKIGWLLNITRAHDAFNNACNLGIEIRDHWDESQTQQRIRQADKD